MAVTPAVALVAAALLGPAIAAMSMETVEKKPVGRAMLLMATATSIAPLQLFWQGGATLQQALFIVTNPQTLALSWLATAAAWLISQAVNIAGLAMAEAGIRRQVQALHRERELLSNEWGDA